MYSWEMGLAILLTLAATIIYGTGKHRSWWRLMAIVVLITWAVRLSDPIVKQLTQ